MPETDLGLFFTVLCDIFIDRVSGKDNAMGYIRLSICLVSLHFLT